MFMKDIVFLGDFISDSGPGIANKSFMEGFKKLQLNVSFSKYNKGCGVKRIFEAVSGILTSRNVCFCYSSKILYLLIPICKLFRKKIAYLIHGYLHYECELNGLSKKEIARAMKLEKFFYKKADLLICVSKFFCEHMKEHEPLYANKFHYFFNAIDIDIPTQNEKVKENIVLSLGGGIGRKNNYAVCRALESINAQERLIKYVIVGKKGVDYDKIIKFPFVEYHEFLSHENVLKLMKKSKLYIQNSWFETFGLAPIEALYCGCSVLITQYQGIKDLFHCNQDLFVIKNPDDIVQLQNLIMTILKKGNNMDLLSSFERTKVEPSVVAKSLYQIIMKM